MTDVETPPAPRLAFGDNDRINNGSGIATNGLLSPTSPQHKNDDDTALSSNSVPRALAVNALGLSPSMNGVVASHPSDLSSPQRSPGRFRLEALNVASTTDKANVRAGWVRGNVNGSLPIRDVPEDSPIRGNVEEVEHRSDIDLHGGDNSDQRIRHPENERGQPRQRTEQSPTTNGQQRNFGESNNNRAHDRSSSLAVSVSASPLQRHQQHSLADIEQGTFISDESSGRRREIVTKRDLPTSSHANGSTSPGGGPQKNYGGSGIGGRVSAKHQDMLHDGKDRTSLIRGGGSFVGGRSGFFRSFPSFFRNGGVGGTKSGRVSEAVMSPQTSVAAPVSEATSSVWELSGRSFYSLGEDGSDEDAAIAGALWDDQRNFPEGHDRLRARRNWRIMRAVLMAIGIFKLGGLTRLRAKELSAAEVKRGLRKNRTGAGQNIIPTMSFYSAKPTGPAEASATQYEALCSQWARFSPATVHRMLRNKFLEKKTVEQEFTSEQFSTTLLFADISGFTRLSARLNAEQLKTHTNQYFTMLIDVVARYGGDIIKFCGDAVMIIWPCEHEAPRGVLQANAMQASECALAMLSQCGKYDVGKGEEAVSLRLHCGIGSGKMYGYLVGAEDRWEYLVAGDPLRQIGEAEPEAKQGEVILSPEAWELTWTDFLAAKTPKGNWLLRGLKAELQHPISPHHGPETVGAKASNHESGGASGPSGFGLPSPKRQRTSGESPYFSEESERGGSGVGATRRSRGSPDRYSRIGSNRPDSACGPSNGGGVGGGGGGTSLQRSKSHRISDSRADNMDRLKLPSSSKDRSPTFSRETYDEEHATEPKRTVTRNMNNSPSVSLGHRRTASAYLAAYIKAQYDGGVEKTMTKLSAALRGFTQESARHAIESDTVEYLAELRFVTTIFINIYGLEEQLEQGGGFSLQQTMELGVGCLSKFGGVLRQFVVDDKGCVMIGAFGLPQYSYEDNEVRAISASKDIIEVFQGLNLAASIGITTGQVYCGFVGASKRCEYAMMGCSVNLSARLMAAAAKNTIQVDFEVWSRAQSFFKFETLTPIKAKGYVDPVPVFRPLDQALTSDTETGEEVSGNFIVGATAELEALSLIAEKVQLGAQTRPVTLLGQAGSGKTHLLRSPQVRDLWKGEGANGRAKGGDGREEAPCIIAVCRNVHANTPYFVWKEVLQNIFFKLGNEMPASIESPKGGHVLPFSPVLQGKEKKTSPGGLGPPDKGGTMTPTIANYSAAVIRTDAAVADGDAQATTTAAAVSATPQAVKRHLALGDPDRDNHVLSSPKHPLQPRVTSSSPPPLLPFQRSDALLQRGQSLSLPPLQLRPQHAPTTGVIGVREGDGAGFDGQSREGREQPSLGPPRLPAPISIALATVHAASRLKEGAEERGKVIPAGAPRSSRARSYLSQASARASADGSKSGVHDAGQSKFSLNLVRVGAWAIAASKIKKADGPSASRANARRSRDGKRSARRNNRSYRIELDSARQAQRSSILPRAGILSSDRMDLSSRHRSSTMQTSLDSQRGSARSFRSYRDAENSMRVDGTDASFTSTFADDDDDPVVAEGQANEILRWIRTTCPEMLPLSPLLEDILFVGFRQSRATAALTPDMRHRYLERLVVEIVRGALATDGGRLMIIIEDAQWMNHYSMKLLLKLARAQLRVMIVISARPFEEYFETIPQEFTSFREMSKTIEMAPLSPADCLILAKAVIGEAVMAAHPDADLLPPGSDVVLHEKSGGGNPLFVRNIAITLRDNMVATGTVKVLADLPAGFFHSLIVSRFDALEPPEQTVLKAAAVVGATFGKGSLLHMLPNNSRGRSENLHAALLKLIEANFISRSVVGQTERFSFVHTSVQETIYKMMLMDQKEFLHEVCAEWHEKHHKNSATYKSVIMHHWMRSGNTYKKVKCHLQAAAKAQESFDSEEVIQHMLALLAIAFGKDMASAIVISMEPFLETNPPLILSKPHKLPPHPLPGGRKKTVHAAGPEIGLETGPGEPRARPGTSPGEGGAGPEGKGGASGGNDGVQLHAKSVTARGSRGSGAADEGLCGWLRGGGALAVGLPWKRRRLSTLVFPGGGVVLDSEAAERQVTVKTAARLGCPVGNLTTRQRKLLVAKDQEWLWASDFLPCLEFSDPYIFDPSVIARWIGEIGMAHLRLGRLLPAHNHMQEALAYLGFKPVPSHALPMQRYVCLALEVANRQPRDPSDALYAARLYCSIADISIKTGMADNLWFINRLVRASTRGVEDIENTTEGIRMIVNLAQEELAKARHQNAGILLARAIELSETIDDPVTKGIVLISLGTFNAGQGMVKEAEEDFASAFDLFAPAGDTSRCREVMIESAYVKVCVGDLEEALFMFREVRDVDAFDTDDFLSQASLHGVALVHVITGEIGQASGALTRLRSLVEDDWARRRGRRGRTATAAEGTSQASLVVMEAIQAYIAAARGDGRTALKAVCRVAHRLARSTPLRFSSALFLHLTTDACFVILEQGMLPHGPEPLRRILDAVQVLVRTLGRFARVFDLISPLYHLGRARWNLLLERDTAAEQDFDAGLIISEHVNFPYAEGLLLMHSTRLEYFPMMERKARAKRGRRTLRSIGACLVPSDDLVIEGTHAAIQTQTESSAGVTDAVATAGTDPTL